MNYWLFKTEPETFSFKQLLRDKKTNWNGVRNFQARNFLKACKMGDLVVIYHSGDERAAVGIARIKKENYPDLDPKKPGEWVQLDIEPVEALERPVTLAEIKSDSQLAGMLLIKQSRLSVMPLDKAHFKRLLVIAKESA